MFPLKYLTALFEKAEGELPPELKAQRTLNTTRIPKMVKYITENENDYVFSSLTASISQDVEFIPSGAEGTSKDIGTLKVPFNAKVLINDGQHRRAAIEEALEEYPELAEETISIVFFIDLDLKKSQQMFADLNRHAVRPMKSLGILYDHRDPMAQLCADLITKVPVFMGMTEKEKSAISNRENKLFTLSAIYKATSTLLAYSGKEQITKKQERLAVQFWKEVSANIPDWMAAKNREVAPYVLRQEYIHTQGLALHSLAIAGCALIEADEENWKTRLEKIKTIDWARDNHQQWNGRAIVAGRINKGSKHVTLTANVIKKVLGLPLSEKEQAIEDEFLKEYDR